MKQIMELSDYVKSRREDFEMLGKELYFLECIRLHLDVHVFNGEFRLYSRDYSLATDFEIKNRSEVVFGQCFGSDDGGYHTEKRSLYPQFYFTLPKDSKNVPVLVQHEGFDKDPRIIIKSCAVTTGSGIYSNEDRRIDDHVTIAEVMAFFEEKGVKKGLLDKLSTKIEEIYKVF